MDVYQTAHLSPYNIYTYMQVDPGDHDEEYALGNVFGGGNQADYAPDSNPENAKKPHTTVHYCENTIDYVYGGGNAADVNATDVTVDGGRFKFIFGGGNGQISAANVTIGPVNISIYGGRVGWYFWGCNMHGDVYGGENNTSFNGCVTGNCPCEQELVVENYYFGANMATIYDGITGRHIACGENFEYKNVYAGSRLATVYGNIELTIEGGKIGNLFGGCEGSEIIHAAIKKYPENWADTVNFPAEHRQGLKKHLEGHPEDFGKGGDITLILKGGKIGNVYGGCNYNGNIEGNIHIVVDSSEYADPKCRLEINYLYGGSRLAAYAPDSKFEVVSGREPAPVRKHGEKRRRTSLGHRPAAGQGRCVRD